MPKASVVPAAAVNMPLPLPPPFRLTVPLRTSNVPALENSRLIAAVFVPPDLRTAPWLMSTGMLVVELSS